MRISKSTKPARRASSPAARSWSCSTGEGAKITPDAVAAACDGIRNDVHQVQPAAISITNATEYGLVYRAAEVAALGEVAKQRGLSFHMDGARLANALASTGESLADVTWRAGVDAL